MAVETAAPGTTVAAGAVAANAEGVASVSDVAGADVGAVEAGGSIDGMIDVINCGRVMCRAPGDENYLRQILPEFLV